MMTQSVGVPLTAKRRSPTSRSRSGSLSESECETPDWSNSGATTQTSSDSARADLGADVEPLGMDAVVVGDQDAHAHTSSPLISRLSPLPLAGEVGERSEPGGGIREDRLLEPAPSPPLPRKREREQTEYARDDLFFIVAFTSHARWS